jgi:protein-disulfide isomerase
MRNRLATAIIAIVAVIVGGFLYAFLSDGSRESPTAVAETAPVTIAQATPTQTATPVVDVTGTLTEAQQAAVNQMIGDYLATNIDFIRDYLVNNPEVIRDAVTELERRRIDDEAARQADAIALHRDLLLYSPRQAVLGNPDGDVTLVEFFDYNCTYCKRALSDMTRLVNEDPNLRVVLKEFPVLGVGSTEAAQVASAVAMIAPDRYEAFHLLLLGSSAQANMDLAISAAVEAGVDEVALRQAMQSDEITATIEESYMLADALALTGTPSFVLGNEVIVGAVGYDAMKSMIDSVRACGETAC